MAEDVEIVLKGKFENGKSLVDTTQKIEDNIEQIGKDAKKTDSNVSSLEKSLKKFAKIIGVAFLANQFKNLVKGSLQAAGAMEQVDIALTTMLGSAEKAAELQKDLIEFAKKTPFEIEGIFSTTKQLLAYGIAQEDIIDTMSNLGNIAAGVGVDMQRLALVFGQVRSTGRLLGQDLNQFTQAGVPLLAELAKLLGVTEAEVIKLKESGQISFDLVKQALEQMTSEGGRFFNLMENQSKTFLGTLSNMADGFFQTKTALGNALLPAAKRFIAFIIPNMDKLTSLIERNTKFINKFAQAFVSGLILIVKAFKGIFQGFSFLSKIIKDLTVEFYIFGLEISQGFKGLKLVIFDFVESILDKLSLLSKLPMFSWIDDAKSNFSSMKDSVIKDINDISEEIKNIREEQNEPLKNIVSSEFDLASPKSVNQEVNTIQQLSTTEPIEKDEKSRLKALKEENQELLQEQKNYLNGFVANQTEADKLLLENNLLTKQQELLQEGEFATKKLELDQQLLDNEIAVEDYKKELMDLNNQAKLEALQIQYDEELQKFQENQLLMDETKLMMQQTQDEAELQQLQMKLDRQAEIEQNTNAKLVQLKVQLGKDKKKHEIVQDKFRTFMQSKEVQGATQVAGELVALQNSKSKEMAAIGKAAAIFQITNQTAQSAMSAFSGMVQVIPGPPGIAAGIAAAALATAYGLERLSDVTSNSFAVGASEIPQDMNANIHKGEMIIPASFAQSIRSGELSLSGSMSNNLDNSSTMSNNFHITNDFTDAEFIGNIDDSMIEQLGNRMGELIKEDIMTVLPTRTA